MKKMGKVAALIMILVMALGITAGCSKNADAIPKGLQEKI
ncbi:hypothetical protein LBYZC6_55100 [Lacrimispora brassicae]